MIWLVASLCVQILCALHAIRTGRNQIWLLFIVLFSMLGCFAYLLIEVAPEYWGNRHVRTVRAHAVDRIDPERSYRIAKDQLSLSDTAANRIALADALVGSGRFMEAQSEYRAGLRQGPGSDWSTQIKLAKCLFETGDSAEALRLLEEVPPAGAVGEQDRRALLRARLLADLGQFAEARLLFEDLVTRIPGEEARCHYAAFLLANSDRIRARQILEEVEQRMKRLDRTQRAAEAPMYKWAMEQLAEVRPS